jgi:hypothetical protein
MKLGASIKTSMYDDSTTLHLGPKSLNMGTNLKDHDYNTINNSKNDNHSSLDYLYQAISIIETKPNQNNSESLPLVQSIQLPLKNSSFNLDSSKFTLLV